MAEYIKQSAIPSDISALTLFKEGTMVVIEPSYPTIPIFLIPSFLCSSETINSPQLPMLEEEPLTHTNVTLNISLVEQVLYVR